MTYTIRKNRDRYGGLCDSKWLPYPEEFTVTGLSYEQAETLAHVAGCNMAGCDYILYVVEDK